MKHVLLALSVSACVWAQSDSSNHDRAAGKEIGSGAGDIGKGTARGAGNLAKGAGMAGKDVTVGTVKGTGKIGKAVKKLF
jgi:hypothetical protein